LLGSFAGLFIASIFFLAPLYTAAQTDFREGNGFYGNERCGDLTCASNEICQKTFGGFDQSQDDNTDNNDVLPPSQIPEGIGEEDDEDISEIYDNVEYRCVNPPNIPGQEENKYYQRNSGSPGNSYNEADLFDGGKEDPGVPVNIINRDALPVDIFNPNPLPTNIVSPNPIPVTVVDDLALYQQKELIDKPLANKQKSATIGEVNKTIREEISDKELVKTPADILAMGVEDASIDPETGALPVAAKKYAQLASQPTPQQFQDLRDQFTELTDIQDKDGSEREKLLPEDDWDKLEDCEYKDQNIGEQGFDCMLAMLQPQNNRFGKKHAINTLGKAQTQIAQKTLRQEQQDGDGFLAKTKEGKKNKGNKNPFTKIITSPGSSVESVVEKTLNSTIDQTIVSSDRCFSSIPKTVQDGTINPLLEEGLFNTDSSNVNLNDVFSTLFNDLLGAIDCELQNEINTALDSLLNNIVSGLGELL